MTKETIFLTEDEFSALTRISVRTLQRWRKEGSGPPYRKFGHRVLYERGEALAWADAQRRTSTSEDAPRAA